MSEDMEEKVTYKKNKAPIIALVAVIALGIIGATFAYFQSTDTFTNQFQTKPYQMQVVETFNSPTDWVPGTTTNKTVVATNKGDVNAAVRVHFIESWVDANNQSLPLQTGGQSAAIINYHSGYATNWTSATESGTTYYYYKRALAKNQSTTALIDSVTFNPNVTISTTDNCVDDNVNHTRTCTTTTTGYGGGKYTLTIVVETAQYDQYRSIWGTNVSIAAAS